MINHFLHPPVFSILGGINRLIAMSTNVVNTSRNVVALGLQHVSEIKLKRCLVTAHDKKIGEPRCVDT